MCIRDRFDPILILFFAFTKGVNTILWCLFFIGLASKFILSDSAILRWFVELSYPIYILHLIPLMIISATLYVYGTGLSQIGNFSLTIIIGFIVCVNLYYIFIKFTPLNWLINGYHKSFLQLKFKRWVCVAQLCNLVFWYLFSWLLLHLNTN